MRLLSFIFFATITFGILNPINGQLDLLSTSEVHIQRGDFDEALNILNIHIESNPQDVKAYLKRASVHAFLGQSSKEEKDIAYAKILNPHAYMYIDASNRSRFYEKKSYGYNFLAEEQKGFSKSPVKEEYYNIYIDELIENKNQNINLRRIISLLSNNKVNEAEMQLAAIEETEEIAFMLLDIYGLIELKSNRLNDAIYYFTKSIKEDPTYSLAYHNRAIAYTILGSYKEAQEDLNTAIQINDDISVFYFTLAKLDEKLNNLGDASGNYLTAVSKNPNYIEAITNHSLIMKSLGRYNESSTALLSVMSETTNESKQRFVKGGIHLTYGEYKQAIEEFDKYLSEHSGDQAALFNRGLAKVLSGDQGGGCKDLEESIDDDPIHANRSDIYISFCKEY